MGNNFTGLEVAIIGMAGQFPGADNIRDYWEMLRDGKEGVSRFTNEILKSNGVSEEYYLNKNYIPAKGVINKPFHFAADYFGINHSDAKKTDPQIRLMIESCWQALKHANIDTETYPGQIGVYAGASSQWSWFKALNTEFNSSAEQFHVATLNDLSFCTRISYLLNLRGPSITIQTACSTSLVAVHTACQALQAGECDVALAGGVSITHPHQSGYLYQEGMINSPDGKTRVFDANACGTVFSNGVGVVVLKRLSDAIEDNDKIYAVIKGSAVNNDGSDKISFTAPSVLGQQNVIRSALDFAEVTPDQISYIEAHGTGTLLGDPIEISALNAVFKNSQSCAIGSVKSNVGHCDAAAGILSLIKSALCVYFKTLVPSIHFEKANAKLELENTPFYVNTETKPWHSSDNELICAGVSAFGVGGTNAHVVLQEFPMRTEMVSVEDLEYEELPNRIEFKPTIAAETTDVLHAEVESDSVFVDDEIDIEGLPQNLLKIFQEYFSNQKISQNDNFFDIGASSLDIVQLHEKINNTYSVNLSISDFYRYTNCQKMTEKLLGMIGNKSQGQPKKSKITKKRKVLNNKNRTYQDYPEHAIAVVGMSGRFPGSKNIQEYWNNLLQGKEGISFFTDDELIDAGISAHTLKAKNYIKAKGIVADSLSFDPTAFGYTARESQYMDPQFRLLHEVTWQVLDDAGYGNSKYRPVTGLFASSGSNHAWLDLLKEEIQDTTEQFGVALLNDREFLTTRIAYKLNLTGPAVTVQSACSSSALAITLACQSLQINQCDLALAGGVSVVTPIKSGYTYAKGMVNSADGHCRPFTQDASGTVFSDGIGMVALKRLDDAIRDNDHIYGVIAGYGVNNDGHEKAGFTAPNADGQAACVKQSLKMAAIQASDVEYLEAHGTATQVGDEVELEGIKDALGVTEINARDCFIGSVKSNIGHTNTASGVASFIKTLLALKHQKIPPSCHGTENKHTSLENTRFRLTDVAADWVSHGRVRTAGVSSFGIGGTNVHITVQSIEEQPASSQCQAELITLSSKSREGLVKTMARLGDFLDEEQHSYSLSDIAYTLQVGRGDYDYRTSLVVENVEALKDALHSLKDSNTLPEALPDQTSGIVFMFPGQGSQYVNMAKDLYQELEIFKTLLDECHERLSSQFSIDLIGLLYSGDSEEDSEKLQNTQITQPVIFAISYSLAKTLELLGIEAKAMIGHSIGEYVAATMAGVMTLDEGLKLVATRGIIMQECEPGVMLSVAAGRDDLEPFLTDKVALATVNSPNSCVIAGSQADIEKVQQRLVDKNFRTRLLKTSHAFHTPMMKPGAEKFKAALAEVNWQKPTKAYISNVTGQWITPSQANSVDYWVEHLCQAVEFHAGIMTCLEKPGLNVFLEVGPGRTLSTFVKQIAASDANILTFNMMRHPLEAENDRNYLLKLVGQLWMRGISVNWPLLYQNTHPKRISLPGYQFAGENMVMGASVLAAKGVEKASETKIQKNEISEWLYTEAWEDISLPDEETQSDIRAALCFVPDITWCQPLCNSLKLDEKSIKFVLPADAYTSAENVITLVPGDKRHFGKLIDELKQDALLPDSVIFAWPLSGQSDLETSWFSVITLIQSWTTSGSMTDFRLLLANTKQPEHSMLNGLVKVITQEVSKCHPRLVQISPLESIERQCEILTEELLATDERFIVNRTQTGRSTLEYHKLKAGLLKENTLLKNEGVYLITGGLGDLGLLFAEYLIKEYGAKVILSGRRALPGKHEWKHLVSIDHPEAEILQRLDELSELGKGEVAYYSSNVSDKHEMQVLLDAIEEQYGCLHGIICAAGVTRGNSFQGINKLTLEDCTPQIETKVEAYKILAELTENKPLDFCLLCSSIASILGGLSFSAYSSVSSFADTFAKQQNSQGKPWISVNWDGWVFERNNSGDPIGSSLDQLLIEPDEGLKILECALQSPLRGQLIISTGDLDKRFEQWVGGHLKPFKLNEFNHSQRAVVSTAQIVGTIVSVWQDFLKVTNISRDDNFFELGANSLDMVQVNKRLTDALDMDFSVVDMFSYPTSELLADFIVNQYGITHETGEQAEHSDTLNQHRDPSAQLNQSSTPIDRQIAIVGLAGTFPGAENIHEFWENLTFGKESVTTFSKEELSEEGIDSGLLENPNYIRAKGVFPNAGEFDAEFFGYTPYEARQMDPQVRALHTCCWQALQDARIATKDNRAKIGLYASASGNLQWLAQAMATAEGSAGQYSAMTVADKDYMSTIVSYKLNLTGPSMVLSTACSSSLVAVNEAVKSLRAGECDIALAGGVSITLPIKAGYVFEEGMIHSKDGKCRAFDIQASGTVFGDGVGIVVLKPLKQALADNDNIYATIIGTAINNDGGMKVGYTAPSTKGQVEVIQSALRDANVMAESIHFVEAHGTGTTLGDPIEFNALKQAFSTDKKNYCRIGSVKSNIGHLNSAAGIAGLIKATLAVKNRILPPTLHYARPNKEIDVTNSPFIVNNQYTELNDTRNPIRAGVSSFGIGGTNVHVVLEEAQVNKDKSFNKKVDNRLPIVLSAPDDKSLQCYKQQLKTFVENNQQQMSVSDIAYSLMQREPMASQFVASACDYDALIKALSSGEKDNVKVKPGTTKRKVVFLFPGQGAQYVTMGHELYHSNGLFKEWCDKGFTLADKYCSIDLKSLFHSRDEDRNLYNTEFAQPLLFIIEYALAQVLKSYGVTPDAMIGHSLGEYVAAALAEVFSFEDAIKMICARGKLMQSTEDAVMLSVMSSSASVKEILTGSLEIALDNSSDLCVVAGSDSDISSFESDCEAKSIKTKRLRVNKAFHTRYMEPVLGDYAGIIREIAFNKPQIAFISNVTGKWAETDKVVEYDYWVNHIRQPVRFKESITEVLKEGNCLFIEVGPGHGLSTLAENHSDYHANHICISCFDRKNEEINKHSELVQKLGKMALLKIDVNWHAEMADLQPRLVHLPPTPLRGTKYPTDIKRLQALFSGNKNLGYQADKPEEPVSQSKAGSNPHPKAKRSVIDELSAIWKLILGVDTIKEDDDFISIGGSSLSAVQVIAKAKSVNLPVNMSMLLSGQTLVQISASLQSDDETTHKGWQFNEHFSPEMYPGSASCLYSAVREKLKHEHGLTSDDAIMQVVDGSPLLGIGVQQFENATKIVSKPVNYGTLSGWPSLQECYSFSYDKQFFEDYEAYRHYCESELALGHLVIVTGSDYYLPFSPSYGLPESEYIKRPLFENIELGDDDIIPHAFVLVGKTPSGYQIYDGSFQYFGEITEQEFEKTVIGFKGLDFMQSHEVYNKSRSFIVITVTCAGKFHKDNDLKEQTLNRLVTDFQTKQAIESNESHLSYYVGLTALDKLIENPGLIASSSNFDLAEIFSRWYQQMLLLRKFLKISKPEVSTECDHAFSIISEELDKVIACCKNSSDDKTIIDSLLLVKSNLSDIIKNLS
ncbi:beta-ketoacyl synthase N-terminal-like domain-containing protein [Xenorhabdus bovienii]|uniref:beta-ketoacyl synthase N-terminal-like domain-containing protein n=1 Tax=Xenorhabdus bovienii TaxID=40576 RepID=UPI003DA3973A